MSTRFTAELHRLYQPMIAPDGRVRAMVLSVGQPADWSAVSQVWQQAQSDWALPAPAIAVSGDGSYQLWFSLDEPAASDEVQVFLTALRDRCLGDSPAKQVVSLPVPQAGPLIDGLLPGREVRPGQWSAFVAPDLAPIFADTPWLDIPPSLEGQADLLARVRRIQPSEWRGAMARLQPLNRAVSVPGRPTGNVHGDPRRFLLSVMNDEQVALALRIEAAKALLPYTP